MYDEQVYWEKTAICLYMSHVLHSIVNGQLPALSLNRAKTIQAFADISGLTQTKAFRVKANAVLYSTSNWHVFQIEREIRFLHLGSATGNASTNQRVYTNQIPCLSFFHRLIQTCLQGLLLVMNSVLGCTYTRQIASYLHAFDPRFVRLACYCFVPYSSAVHLTRLEGLRHG